MKKLFLVPALSLFLLLGITLNASATTKVIITFGDSITAGCGNTEPYDEESECGLVENPDDTYGLWYDYEDELQSRLDADNYKYVVQNYGYGGETTDEALDGSPSSRFDEVLSNDCNSSAAYILIMEGTNDLLFYQTPSVIEYNLSQMIEKSIEAGLIPLVATITPDLTSGHEYKEISATNTLIRSMVETMVEEGENVTLVDQYNETASNWSTYTSTKSCYAYLSGNSGDKLHPDQEGFYAIGDNWYEALQAILPAKATLPFIPILLNK